MNDRWDPEDGAGYIPTEEGGHRQRDHDILFVFMDAIDLPTTVKETQDGHIYPEGGRHCCRVPGCPAHDSDKPMTDLGTLGPIEREFRVECGLEPTPKVLSRIREFWREGDE